MHLFFAKTLIYMVLLAILAGLVCGSCTSCDAMTSSVHDLSGMCMFHDKCNYIH